MFEPKTFHAASMRLPVGIGIHFDETAPANGATAVAEPPAAAPAAPAAATVTQPSLKDRVASLKGEAREHWQMHGDLEAAEALAKPNSDVKAESSTAPVPEEPEPPSEEEGAGTTAPESGPGKKVTEQTKSPRTSWSELRERAARAEAERDLLKKQLEDAKKPNSQAAPAKEEAQPPAVDPNRPKRPKLSEYQTVQDYETAMDKYEADKEIYDRTTLDQRERTRTEAQHFQQASTKWEQEKTKAREKYKDFDAVAFNPKTPASLPQILEIQSREDATEIMYYLGKHPEVSAQVAELTDIPIQHGKFSTWAELNAAMAKNPGLAYLVGEKRGLAKAELQRIADSLKKTPAPSPKERVAQQARPSGEVTVEAKSGPMGDEDADLIKRAAQGDAKAARVWKERQNKRELQAMGT